MVHPRTMTFDMSNCTPEFYPERSADLPGPVSTSVESLCPMLSVPPSHWFLRRVADPAIFSLFWYVFSCLSRTNPQFLNTWASPYLDIPPSRTFYLLIVVIDAYIQWYALNLEPIGVLCAP